MKRYLADTSAWIVRRGWFCWRGYYKLEFDIEMYSLGGVRESGGAG